MIFGQGIDFDEIDLEILRFYRRRISERKADNGDDRQIMNDGRNGRENDGWNPEYI